MEFRIRVETLDHCVFVHKCAEYANCQVVETQHVQFVLRTKDLRRVRLTSNLHIKEYYQVFFEVTY